MNEATEQPATAMDAAPAPSTKRAMLIVFLVVFIDLLGFGIVLPLIPQVTDGYLAGRSQTEQGIAIGLLFSLFSLMQFVFSPIWGRLSDRIGRRPILMMSLIGSVVFYALFAVGCALPHTWGWWAIGVMLASRIGAGIAGASVSTATAVIADCTTLATRAKGMGLIGAAFGIGFTFGPLIAFGLLTVAPATDTAEGIDQSVTWLPGAAASLFSLVALGLALRLLPETLKKSDRPPEPRSIFDVRRSLEVLRMPAVGPLILTYFLSIIAFANYEATLARFTKDVFGFSQKQNFLVFAGVGLVLVLAQGVFYRRVAGKIAEVKLLLVGLAFMLLGLASLTAVAVFSWQLRMIGVPSTPFEWQFYLASAVAVFGFAFVNPSVSAMISKRADPTRQGEVLGVNQSFTAIARILGPLNGSLVYAVHESYAVPFACAVLLLMLIFALIPTIRRDATSVP